MFAVLNEFLVQILTVVFMIAVITAAVILGHKFRNFMDKKKAEKEGTEEA